MSYPTATYRPTRSQPPRQSTGDATEPVTQPLPVVTFRPEIEGLRAIAVLLVVIYHIWLGRVSGGVDVFLLLTGFLITGSLLRMVDRSKRVKFGAFFSRLLRRLVPTAAIVLGGTVVLMFAVLPQSRWLTTLDEIVVSALYYENWQLATNAVDYLGQNNAASPTQHFWSLSIQGQFYILWALFIAVLLLVAKAVSVPIRNVAFTGFAMVFSGSLVYSIMITATDQRWAYFDTWARMWEFALGGMLAIVIASIKIRPLTRVLMGWFGLIALVLCGLLIQVSQLFPGWVALWPTLAAVLVILAGTTGHAAGPDRLLTWRPLTWFGGISYALYLWHWPLLIGYLVLADTDSVGVFPGLVIILLAVGLSTATKWLLEDRINIGYKKVKRFQAGWSVGVAAVCLVPVLVVALLSSVAVANNKTAFFMTPEIALQNYPGAQVLLDPQLAANLPNVPVKPSSLAASEDLPLPYSDGCHAEVPDTEIETCEYGDPDGEYTIALVGASRSAHWFPALLQIAVNNGWRLLSYTKSACQFSTDAPRYQDRDYTECTQWRNNLMAVLDSERPDLVVTSSTRASKSGETTHPGFVERWQQLQNMGISLLGIRDLPHLTFDAADCIDQRAISECVADPSLTQAPTDPAPSTPGIPNQVALIDMTEYVCPQGQCPAVIGNVLVYRDTSHMTATYAETLAPMLDEKIKSITGWR